MKLNNLNSEAQVFGEVIQNEVTIDTSNMNKIVAMLSSNLYSSPIESFIREITSNAWDSHIEAGNDEPVIITMERDVVDSSNIKVSIRDFGTGLSPTRFNEVFRYMGSSTKTESNDYLGMYGIGKMSPLAVTDMVYITSFYDGIKYDYLMYKNGMGINIDLIDEEETMEPNGVLVSVSISNSKAREIENAVTSQLMFFENVYFNNKVNTYEGDLFNNNKIKHYETFAVSKNLHTTKILLGKVLYPFDHFKLNGLTDDEIELVNDINNSDIAIKFNIGELDVNPARETLHYTERTIRNIIDRIKEVVKELHSLKYEEIGDEISPDRLFKLNRTDTLLIKDLSRAYIIPEYSKEVSVDGIIIKYDLLYRIIDNLSNHKVNWSERFLQNGKVYLDKRENYLNDFVNSSIYNYSPDTYTNIQKKYVRQTFYEGLLHKDWNEFAKSTQLKRDFIRFYQNKDKDFKSISKVVYKVVVDKMKSAGSYDLSGLDQDFVDSNKPIKRGAGIINYYDHSRYGDYKATLEELKEKEDTLILIEKGNRNFLRRYDGYRVLSISVNNRKRLLKKGIGITVEEFIESKRDLIIEHYKKRIQRDLWQWEDRRGLEKLSEIVIIPKEDMVYLKESESHEFEYSVLYHRLNNPEEVLEDTTTYNKYKEVIEISKAFNLDNSLGVTYFRNTLHDLGYVVDGVLKI